MSDNDNIKDGVVLGKVADRAMRKGSTFVSESECDAIERFIIDYAAKRGVNIKPNATPKPWVGAQGDEP